MYLVTESQDTDTGTQGVHCDSKSPPSNWYHYLHALDLTSPSLAEKSGGPVRINPSGGNNGFASQKLLQRPGLLFLGPGISPTSPTVYMAFSMMDGSRPNPSGWVLAYDGGNLGLGGFPLVFDTTPNAPQNTPAGGGIWCGGCGLAAALDFYNNNYIYVSTGDGVFDANQPSTPNSDYGDSFVKLTTELQVSDYFAPADAFYRWDPTCKLPTEGNDFDFGSTGVVAVPLGVNMKTAYKFVAIKADKENYLWVMDRTNPGKSNACIPASCSCSNTDGNAQRLSFSMIHNAEPQARSTPAFWFDGTTPFLYFAPAQDYLYKYPLTGDTPHGPILDWTAHTVVSLGYAVTPSISSKGNQNGTGIVWALTGGSSPLYAFDAETLTTLYSSNTCPTRDAIGSPTKFSVPTIANGYVFVGTQTDFDIFGTTTATCN